MHTLVISDLHLGASEHNDILRQRNVRDTFKQQLVDVDRLVLLGDIVELRHGSPQQAVQLAAEVFADFSQALPKDAEIIFVPGNHDHALIKDWLAAKTQQVSKKHLDLAERIAPSEASAYALQLAQEFQDRPVDIYYPGVWLRDDCYATHGHYLDFHLHLPTLERIAISLMVRFLIGDADSIKYVEDYERCLAPVIDWIDAVSRWSIGDKSLARGHSANVRSRLLASSSQSLKERLAVGAFPLAVKIANQMGLGTFTQQIDEVAIRDDAIRAFRSALKTLSLNPTSVIFGHTHRAGPLPLDRQGNWRTETGTRLYNCGSWLTSSHRHGLPSSLNPYWPGRGITIADTQRPRLELLITPNV